MQGAHQTDDRMLGHGVDRVLGDAFDRRVRGRDDDGPAALPAHHRQRRAQTPYDGMLVDANDRVIAVQIEVRRILVHRIRSGVEDEQIEPFAGGGHGGAGDGGIGEIADDRLATEFRGDLPDEWVTIHQHAADALCGQPAGGVLADSAGRPGDHCGLGHRCSLWVSCPRE